MKKCILTILASLICLFLFADISSTATGGDRCWNTPATWIGGIIPGANDNVIINSSVRACNNYCNNLSITASGILENYNTSMWLQVNGDLENHGTIRNSNASYTFTVKLAGDLSNYGTINNYYFYLNNVGLANIWMDPEAPAISCPNFTSQSSTGSYRADRKSVV